MPMFKIYKTFIIIAIVVAPIYWLMITEDGKRRTDTLLLWITGGDPININFEVLDDRYSVQDWQQVYEDIDWQCKEQASAWGDEICYSEVSSYNGIPARYVSVFFAEGYSSALKLVYRNQYHAQLGAELLNQLGKPEPVSAGPGDAPDSNSILRWQTDHGMLLLKQQLDSGEEEASLLWLPRS
jgi:hypothetical protein